jgi:Predicted integral membrane protein (DUF2269).
VIAFSLGVYHTLKFVHILAAVVWVGGGIFAQMYATRLRRANDPDRLARFARDIEFFGSKVFAPISGIALLMGISMVLYAPFIYWSETWIVVGLAGFAATFITGAFFLGPESGKIAKAFEAEGATSPTVQASIKRIFLISRIDAVVLVVVILDMVFKPGTKGLA